MLLALSPIIIFLVALLCIIIIRRLGPATPAELVSIASEGVYYLRGRIGYTAVINPTKLPRGQGIKAGDFINVDGKKHRCISIRSCSSLRPDRAELQVEPME